MLVKLGNHFEPGGPFLKHNFLYEFQLFQNVDSIPEEVRIWLCLLDDSMRDLVEAEFDKMQMFSFLFKSYVGFIGSERFRSGTLEVLRKVTYNTLRSLADLRREPSKELVNADKNLPEYKVKISNCLRSISVEYFKHDYEPIHTTLQHIISHVKMATDQSTALSKVFENLLTDIRDLPFEWFIQLPSSDKRDMLLRTQFIVPVDNRWKDTEHQCFQVMNQKGFVEVYRALHGGNDIPKHYQLHVLKVLLQQVDKLATKQAWKDGIHLSRRDQLEAMAALIISIRKSLLHFREQPDYANFDDFQLKTIEPVVIAVEQSSSLEDFHNRVALIRSLRTRAVPNLNTTNIEEALKIFGHHRSGYQDSKDDFENYVKAFSRYSTTFKERILQSGTGTHKERMQNIYKHVSNSNTPMPVSSWTPEFKLTTLPDILASLSAVWSLIVSKDIDSLEILVKPTCVQMCCVFLYLMEPSSKLLIQLSATQGKMLVLGLIAALYAVCGHEVVIICYNSSLFRRNATDLLELFELFSVESKISFQTIEDLARQQSEMIYHKYAKYIHQCLDIPYSDTSMSTTQNSLAPAESVLIIGEMEVCCLEKPFYKHFVRFVGPIIPGLATVQEKIYTSDRKITVQDLEDFIEKSDLPQMAELRAFLDKPKHYKLINELNQKETRRTNRTLFQSHLNIMLRSKKFTVKLPENCYQLTSEGMFKIHHSEENDILSYKTTAVYFQMKKSNFQQIVNDQANYGCLQAIRLPFPCRNLLSRCSLGFQSTFSMDLYDELSYGSIRYWSWDKSLICPNDLCPTKFDSTQDFLCVPSELDWMISIMTAIHTAIERHESVLVFFKNVVELHRFQKEFASQLNRLIVSTIEASSNRKDYCKGELLLDDVSILVIDDVDSISEERDTRVIQTFFSIDANEENLIRKQAERKHSNGSYELILRIPQVCHVFSVIIGPVETDSYDLLAYLRNRCKEEKKIGSDLIHTYSSHYDSIQLMCDTI